MALWQVFLPNGAAEARICSGAGFALRNVVLPCFRDVLGMPDQTPPHPELLHKFVELEHSSKIAEYNADVQRALETYKTANKSGLEAMKAIAFLNSGAAVATLAFIGHLAAIHAETATIMGFVRALVIFVVGAFSAILAFGVTYLMSRFSGIALDHQLEEKSAGMDDRHSDEIRHRGKAKTWYAIAEAMNIAAAVFCILALVWFVRGAFIGYRAFGRVGSESEPPRLMLP